MNRIKKSSFINIEGLIRKISIKHRLIITFTLISMIPLGLSGIMSYTKSKDAIENKISTYSVQIVNQIALNIQSEISRYINILDEISFASQVQEGLAMLKLSNSSQTSNIQNQIKDLCLDKFGKEKGVSSVEFYPKESNSFIYLNRLAINSDDVDGIIKQVEEADSSYVWINTSLSNGEQCLVLGRTLKSDKNFENLGTLLISIYEKEFSKIYSSLDLGKDTHLLVMDQSGDIVSSFDPELYPINSKFQDLSVLDTISNNNLQNEYSFNYKDRLFAFYPIKDTSWFICTLIPNEYLFIESRAIGIMILLFSIICLFIATMLSVLITNSISRPLNALIAYMNQAKNGDLNIDFREEGRDEISKLILNFKDMLKNICYLIIKIRASSNNIVQFSDELMFSACTAEEGNHQIFGAMEEVERGSTSQVMELLSITESTSQLSSNIKIVEDNIDLVITAASEVKSLGNSSVEVIDTLRTWSEEVETGSEDISNQIFELESSMKSIENVVSAIYEIARQIKLLSLNATIESARASQNGKGFAVVASEIRKLSEKTNSQLSQISLIIKQVLCT